MKLFVCRWRVATALHVVPNILYHDVCGQVIEEVIHEEAEVESISETASVETMPFEEPVAAMPQQTYHHMLGRSFGVAFNDRSFIRPEVTASGTDRYYYGNCGT